MPKVGSSPHPFLAKRFETDANTRARRHKALAKLRETLQVLLKDTHLDRQTPTLRFQSLKAAFRQARLQLCPRSPNSVTSFTLYQRPGSGRAFEHGTPVPSIGFTPANPSPIVPRLNFETVEAAPAPLLRRREKH